MQTFMIVGLAFAMGGVIKGATGVGAPLIAVPVMTSFFDVRFAVAVFVLPNLVTNLVQAFIYRKALKSKVFLLILSLSVGGGAFAGSLMLYQASRGLLEMLMAGIVLLYVGFRLTKPDWQLSLSAAHKLSAPMGFLSGFLQGVFGISAPATLPFLNAIKFERTEFIVIASVIFTTMSVIQLPTLMHLGIMHLEHVYLGLLAVIPLVACMPVGAFILRHASPQTFDKAILIILVGVAARLLWPL